MTKTNNMTCSEFEQLLISAAGGFADGGTTARIRAAGGAPEDSLGDNDSWHALRLAGDLVKTGPTGTNVNDIALVLCGEPE